MDDEDWRLLSEVNRSRYRREALTYLNRVEEPRTPTEVASKIDAPMNHVSRALREMKERDLVTVINPEAPYDRRYRLTNQGVQIAQKLTEIRNE